MKQFRSFTLPQDIVEVVGEEWNGEFTLFTLTAKEYREVIETLIQKKRMSASDWDGVVPQSEMYEKLIYASVKYNGKTLPNDVPAKLYDLLVGVAVPLNTCTFAEARSLFLDSKAEKKRG